jgi:hypothetical protein
VFNTQTAQWKRQGKIEGMTDKEIDEYLKKISESHLQVIIFKKQENIVNEGKEEFLKKFKEQFNYVYLCDELKLFKEISKGDNEGIYAFDLTKKGRKVLRLGGWLKYIERQEDVEKKKELKEDYELKITEFQARNQHLPYIVSFCGVFISLISLLITCSSNNDEPLQKKEHTMEYKLEKTKSETKKILDSDTLLIEKK